jgi:hypothetical protein
MCKIKQNGGKKVEKHLLRHYISTLSYRTKLALKDAPAEFSELQIGEEVRKPVEIVNHMTFLMAYTISCFKDFELDEYRKIHEWEEEIERFYRTLEELDKILQEEKMPKTRTIEKLLQGPLADAMTHVGQLTMMRRIAGAPVPYENFMDAKIEARNLRNN